MQPLSRGFIFLALLVMIIPARSASAEDLGRLEKECKELGEWLIAEEGKEGGVEDWTEAGYTPHFSFSLAIGTCVGAKTNYLKNSWSFRDVSGNFTDAKMLFYCDKSGAQVANIERVRRLRGKVFDKSYDEWMDNGEGGPSSATATPAEPYGRDRCEALFKTKLKELNLIAPPPAITMSTPRLDALKAYANGDYATVMKLMRPLAERGEAFAQDYLGNLYANGYGVPMDYAEAMKWYRRAAEQGDADAQWNLGRLYYSALGAPQDYAEAMKWLRKAAEQGVAPAQYHLGFMYYYGLGAPRDYLQAYMWANLSTASDDDQAARIRELASGNMTREQIAFAQRMAQEWLAAHPPK